MRKFNFHLHSKEFLCSALFPWQWAFPCNTASRGGNGAPVQWRWTKLYKAITWFRKGTVKLIPNLVGIMHNPLFFQQFSLEGRKKKILIATSPLYSCQIEHILCQYLCKIGTKHPWNCPVSLCHNWVVLQLCRQNENSGNLGSRSSSGAETGPTLESLEWDSDWVRVLWWSWTLLAPGRNCGSLTIMIILSLCCIFGYPSNSVRKTEPAQLSPLYRWWNWDPRRWSDCQGHIYRLVSEVGT